MSESMVFRIRAETEVWTGDADGKNSYLQLTGLLGGIRWWAEALVRAYGLRVCDPTAPRDKGHPGFNAGSRPCDSLEDTCVICELFGNAGLKNAQGKAVPHAAKFAVRCWNESNGQPNRLQVRTGPLKARDIFYLEFCFQCERKRKPYEPFLLAKTLDIISRYGSIGGKTVLKPTSESRLEPPATSYNELNEYNGWVKRHTDYGIIALEKIDGKVPADWDTRAAEDVLGELHSSAPRLSFCGLPSLDYFWFVPDRTLFVHPSATGKSINELLGLADTKKGGLVPTLGSIRNPNEDAGLDRLRRHFRGAPEPPSNNPTVAKRLLALGLGEPRSKKVFSFRNPSRTWGYVLDPSLWDSVVGLLETVDIKPEDIRWGKDIKKERIAGP